jgi:nucleoside-diphosphate-sugar epimerase
MTNETILITGACGQLGTELTEALRKIHQRVIATDLKDPIAALGDAEFCKLDVLHKPSLVEIIHKEKVTQVYHLAAILSATGEKQPELAWRINMKGLRNVLDVSAELRVKKVFFPSTIAVFGSSTPKINTPQFTAMEPNTIYGISKQAGEQWCQWYFRNKGLDVRSVRYPGLISYKTKAGGGTTDYAVEIFHEAVAAKKYACFLKENTVLPMMYMPDAVRGTIELMEAESEKISVRTSYNFAGFSFAPKDIVAAIQYHIADFEVEYAPDFRQQIAESWPQSIDDSFARKDWGWQPEFNLSKTVADMLLHVASPV